MSKGINKIAEIAQIWKLKKEDYHVFVTDIDDARIFIYYVPLQDFELESGPIDILDFYDVYEWVSG